MGSACRQGCTTYSEAKSHLFLTPDFLGVTSGVKPVLIPHSPPSCVVVVVLQLQSLLWPHPQYITIVVLTLWGHVGDEWHIKHELLGLLTARGNMETVDMLSCFTIIVGTLSSVCHHCYIDTERAWRFQSGDVYFKQVKGQRNRNLLWELLFPMYLHCKWELIQAI